MKDQEHQTAEQTLRQKDQDFRDVLLNSGHAKLLTTDNIVEDPNNVIRFSQGAFNGRADLRGNTIRAGSFALFEIIK